MTKEVTTEQMINDYFALNFESVEGFEDRVELRWAYEVLTALEDEIGGTDVHRMLLSHYVPSGVSRKSFSDSVSTIERLILPHAAELAKAPSESVRGALRGLLKRSELWHGYKDSFFDGWMKLSTDPLMVQTASNELRVIAAVESIPVTGAIRRSVLSTNSDKCIILSMNTPLDLLVMKRPHQADGIVSVILREHEVNGDRIAAILDSASLPLASGTL